LTKKLGESTNELGDVCRISLGGTFVLEEIRDDNSELSENIAKPLKLSFGHGPLLSSLQRVLKPDLEKY